jgi:hypothetical protein
MPYLSVGAAVALKTDMNSSTAHTLFMSLSATDKGDLANVDHSVIER